MTIMLAGDDEKDIIDLPNGMTIKIEYGHPMDNDFYFWGGRLTAEHRRVRLFDQKDELIAEIIEENPSYVPKLGISEANLAADFES